MGSAAKPPFHSSTKACLIYHASSAKCCRNAQIHDVSARLAINVDLRQVYGAGFGVNRIILLIDPDFKGDGLCDRVGKHLWLLRRETRLASSATRGLLLQPQRPAIAKPHLKSALRSLLSRRLRGHKLYIVETALWGKSCLAVANGSAVSVVR